MAPRLKRFEESGNGKGEGKISGWKGGEKGGTSSTPCRFYLSDDGSKKGKTCGWLHQGDDKRRCWNCGATSHYAPVCEKPKEAAGKGGKSEGKENRINKVVKKDNTDASPSNEAASESSKSEAGGSEVMKELIAEANKMIKGLALKGGEAGGVKNEESEDIRDWRLRKIRV